MCLRIPVVYFLNVFIFSRDSTKHCIGLIEVKHIMFKDVVYDFFFYKNNYMHVQIPFLFSCCYSSYVNSSKCSETVFHVGSTKGDCWYKHVFLMELSINKFHCGFASSSKIQGFLVRMV